MIHGRYKIMLMKKLLLCILCIGIYTISSGAFIVEIKSTAGANEILPTFEKIKKQISLKERSGISLKGFETFDTRKMNFFERIVFKVMPMKLRKSIAGNGDIKKEKLRKLFTRLDKGETSRFHLGGFILGLILGPVGVLISYFIKDDHKRKRIKWAWIGFAAWVAIIIVIAFYQKPIA